MSWSLTLALWGGLIDRQRWQSDFSLCPSRSRPPTSSMQRSRSAGCSSTRNAPDCLNSSGR